MTCRTAHRHHRHHLKQHNIDRRVAFFIDRALTMMINFLMMSPTSSRTTPGLPTTPPPVFLFAIVLLISSSSCALPSSSGGSRWCDPRRDPSTPRCIDDTTPRWTITHPFRSPKCMIHLYGNKSLFCDTATIEHNNSQLQCFSVLVDPVTGRFDPFKKANKFDLAVPSNLANSFNACPMFDRKHRVLFFLQNNNNANGTVFGMVNYARLDDRRMEVIAGRPDGHSEHLERPDKTIFANVSGVKFDELTSSGDCSAIWPNIGPPDADGCLAVMSKANGKESVMLALYYKVNIDASKDATVEFIEMKRIGGLPLASISGNNNTNTAPSDGVQGRNAIALEVSPNIVCPTDSRRCCFTETGSRLRCVGSPESGFNMRSSKLPSSPPDDSSASLSDPATAPEVPTLTFNTANNNLLLIKTDEYILQVRFDDEEDKGQEHQQQTISARVILHHIDGVSLDFIFLVGGVKKRSILLICPANSQRLHSIPNFEEMFLYTETMTRTVPPRPTETRGFYDPSGNRTRPPASSLSKTATRTASVSTGATTQPASSTNTPSPPPPLTTTTTTTTTTPTTTAPPTEGGDPKLSTPSPSPTDGQTSSPPRSTVAAAGTASPPTTSTTPSTQQHSTTSLVVKIMPFVTIIIVSCAAFIAICVITYMVVNRRRDTPPEQEGQKRQHEAATLTTVGATAATGAVGVSGVPSGRVSPRIVGSTSAGDAPSTLSDTPCVQMENPLNPSNKQNDAAARVAAQRYVSVRDLLKQETIAEGLILLSSAPPIHAASLTWHWCCHLCTKEQPALALFEVLTGGVKVDLSSCSVTLKILLECVVDRKFSALIEKYSGDFEQRTSLEQMIKTAHPPLPQQVNFFHMKEVACGVIHKLLLGTLTCRQAGERFEPLSFNVANVEYEVIRKPVGSGSSANVYVTLDGKYAIKHCKPESKERFDREISTFKQFKGRPQDSMFVKQRYVCHDNEKLLLVMPYYPHGSLHRLLQPLFDHNERIRNRTETGGLKRAYDSDQCLELFMECLLLQVNALHTDFGVSHNDIYDKNILLFVANESSSSSRPVDQITKDTTPILIDFGASNSPVDESDAKDDRYQLAKLLFYTRALWRYHNHPKDIDRLKEPESKQLRTPPSWSLPHTIDSRATSTASLSGSGVTQQRIAEKITQLLLENHTEPNDKWSAGSRISDIFQKQ